MPRLSRKKEKSKIIKKKNTKKRTKKITTKKSLKGGVGRRIDTGLGHSIGRFGFGSNPMGKYNKMRNNFARKDVIIKRDTINTLMKKYSEKIIELIDFGCLMENSKEIVNNNIPGFICDYDAVKKISEIFDPIIEKLKKENNNNNNNEFGGFGN